jgi:hypothetical protein
MRSLVTLVLSLLVLSSFASASPAEAAGAPQARAPQKPYHLELAVTPEAVFPYLGKFGDLDVHVYPTGVRGEALWLNGFSRIGDKAVTVVNPLGRMYVDVQIDEITAILTKLAGNDGAVERAAAPVMGPQLKGTVGGIAATRHRLVFGPTAWIDVWTTDVIPPNPHFRLLVSQVVSGISPATGLAASKLPGTPLFVELNFRRFKKVPIVKLKKLTFSAEGEEDALTLGSLYIRASVFEKILGVR